MASDSLAGPFSPVDIRISFIYRRNREYLVSTIVIHFFPKFPISNHVWLTKEMDTLESKELMEADSRRYLPVYGSNHVR